MTQQPPGHIDTTRAAELLTDLRVEQRRVEHRPGRYDRFAKPVLDRVAGGLLCLALLPIMAAVALVVLVSLGRPLFYPQRRVGQGGQVFTMYKFRTMRPDRRREERTVPTHTDRRRRHKSPDDPRHTRVGRFLRRTSLDELPQLFNVLTGSMSLVGPRPELEKVVSNYAAWQHQRHQVKPGITGLWQITARSEAGDMHLHTDLDLDYIENLRFRTDLRILWRTLPAALSRGE